VSIYHDRRPETFDVPSLCVSLGYEVVGTREAHAFVSAAGSLVRQGWIRKHGVRPDTELTQASGDSKRTHHKARYPLTFRPAAVTIIEGLAASMDAMDAAQLDLWSSAELERDDE
jgi:hypothetical protein